MRRTGLMAMAGLWGGLCGSVLAQAPTCVKADFETVVDEAAAALRDLARKNTPQFQAKLRQLKDKRGWGEDRFLAEAEPLVRDEKIAGFDRKLQELLSQITSASQAGGAGGDSPLGNCALLAELRGTMKVLVETQTAKWTYMFDKLEGELRK
jgi:hypothetical protein